MQVSFGSQPAIVYGPPPVYYHPPVDYVNVRGAPLSPLPPRPLTNGELIIVGAVVIFFIIMFIWAAATGNIQYNDNRMHSRPQPYYKSKFSNPNIIPTELDTKYPFGNEYDPALFSSGCSSF